MIHRNFGKQTLLCDGCDDELGEFFEKDDFPAMIEHAKEEGWAIRLDGPNWHHFCPGCKGEDRLAAQRKLLGL